jgi:hypothetical protein
MMSGCVVDSTDSGQGHVKGFCEHGNKSWGSLKDGEFIQMNLSGSFCPMELSSYLVADNVITQPLQPRPNSDKLKHSLTRYI